MTHRHTENMDLNNHQPNPAFYHLGRLIAVLEQGARAHGEVPWLEQYSLRQCR